MELVKDFGPKEDQLTRKMRETIEFQKSYADELYWSNNWEDYDMWFLAWLEHAMEIIENNTPLIHEVIRYKAVPTDRVIIQRVFYKRYVAIEWDEILQKMVDLCRQHEDILSDDQVRLQFWIEMKDIRKTLDDKNK